jgi:hypothetical protein
MAAFTGMAAPSKGVGGILKVPINLPEPGLRCLCSDIFLLEADDDII